MTTLRICFWVALALLVTLAAAQDTPTDNSTSTDPATPPDTEEATSPATPPASDNGTSAVIEPPPPLGSTNVPPVPTATRLPITTEAPPPSENNGTLPPITTPSPPGGGDSLPLEPWVIVILCVAGVLICGLMVFAAKRTKAKKKGEKERTARIEKDDKDFEKRMKGIEKL
jgi:hypothetical protein